jgi:hypothetical protein
MRNVVFAVAVLVTVASVVLAVWVADGYVLAAIVSFATAVFAAPRWMIGGGTTGDSPPFFGGDGGGGDGGGC